MEEDFILLLKYKGKVYRFKVTDPTASLFQLTKNLQNSGTFEMPSTDNSGAPILYYFAKVKDGKSMILQPKHGRNEMHLIDYNVKNGDTLLIISEPVAG